MKAAEIAELAARGLVYPVYPGEYSASLGGNVSTNARHASGQVRRDTAQRARRRGGARLGHHGNVHMAIFQQDPALRSRIVGQLFEAGLALGGAISGEHGVGKEKKKWFLALEDPTKLELMRRIKAAFDPNGILNHGTIFD